MRVRQLFFAVIALLAVSCSSGTSSTPATNSPNTVSMSASQFNPASITVTKGTTVTWKNDDAIVHTSTGDNSLWNTGDIGGGTSKSFTFTTIGTFTYFCKYHVSMGMRGTVIVK